MTREEDGVVVPPKRGSFLSRIGNRVLQLLDELGRSRRTDKEDALDERTLLAFSGGENGEDIYEVTFDDGTRNILVLGATGSGKTVSAMRPALKRLVEQNCSGLILDVKGDYYRLLKDICPDKLHIVGPGDDASQTNLIAAMTDEMIEAFLLDIVKASTGNQEGAGYWGTMAVQDCILVAKYIRTAEERAPSLADFYEALTDPGDFCRRLDMWLESWRPGEGLRQALQLSASNPFGLLYKGGSRYAAKSRLEKGKKDSLATLEEQYAWHVQKILPALSRFARTAAVREKLCAGDAIDFVDILYRQKKIILFDMPFDLFGPAAFTAGRLLRINVMVSVLANAWRYKGANGIGLGRSHFTFLLMDEYQQFVSANYGSVVSGLPDDNTWFDRSRSFGHINIVATQGISSLLSQCEKDVVGSIVQNFRSIVCLPTTDAETLKFIDGIGGGDAVARVLRPREHGDGFLYCSSARRRHGGTISSVIQKWAGEPTYSFMCPDKNSPEGGRDRFVRDSEPDELAVRLNRGERGNQRLFDCKWNGIHVVTTSYSKGYADFLHGLCDRGAEYVRDGKLAEIPRVVGRYNISDSESVFSGPEGAWCDAIERALLNAKPGDIIAIVRGGGDRESDDLALFDSKELIRLVKACQIRVIVATGIAHTEDVFEVEGVVDVPAATPSQAGHEICKFIADQQMEKPLEEGLNEQEAISESSEFHLVDSYLSGLDLLRPADDEFDTEYKLNLIAKSLGAGDIFEAEKITRNVIDSTMGAEAIAEATEATKAIIDLATGATSYPMSPKPEQDKVDTMDDVLSDLEFIVKGHYALPGFDGRAAFDGALRFFETDDAWMTRWGCHFGDLVPDLRLIASDAFGTMFGLDKFGKVAIFWAETGDIEPLGVDEIAFLSMIMKDPNGTINLDLYQAAVREFGPIGPQQHFAFRVETALGGQVALDNLMVMDADEHMRVLGALAQQIHYDGGAMEQEAIVFVNAGDNNKWGARIGDLDITFDEMSGKPGLTIHKYGSEIIFPCDNDVSVCPDGKELSQNEYEMCEKTCPFKREEECLQQSDSMWGGITVEDLSVKARKMLHDKKMWGQFASQFVQRDWLVNGVILSAALKKKLRRGGGKGGRDV